MRLNFKISLCLSINNKNPSLLNLFTIKSHIHWSTFVEPLTEPTTEKTECIPSVVEGWTRKLKSESISSSFDTEYVTYATIRTSLVQLSIPLPVSKVVLKYPACKELEASQAHRTMSQYYSSESYLDTQSSNYDWTICEHCF